MSSKQETILGACKADDLEDLQTLLQTSRDSTEIFDTQNPKSLNTSLASSMLEIGAKDESRTLIDLIFSNCNKVPITEATIRAALAKSSIPLYSALLSHDPSIIHIPLFEDRDSQIGYATRCLASLQFIEFLLTLGLDPNPASPAMQLLCMVNLRAREDSLELCKLLLDHGARLEHSGALASAAKHGRVDVMEFLIGKGADVNDIFTDEICGHVWAPLHSAIAGGKIDAVELLLGHGADVEVRDQDGRTAVEVAAEGGDDRIKRLLVRYDEKG